MAWEMRTAFSQLGRGARVTLMLSGVLRETSNAPPPVSTGEIDFQCADGRWMKVEFEYADFGRLEVRLPDGNQIELRPSEHPSDTTTTLPHTVWEVSATRGSQLN